MFHKICFLSLNSYPILAEKNLGFVGGAEVEQVSLARNLLFHGYDVSFITYDHGQKPVDYVGKIKVIKTYRREKVNKMNPLSKLRYIWKALEKADSDLYFHEAGSHGVLSFWRRAKRKRFIYRVASDMIVLNAGRKFIERFAIKIDIKRADVVIAQNKLQRRKLKEKFCVNSVVIKNGLSISQYRPHNRPQKLGPLIVLWVAEISEVKQPELFIELAKAIPSAQFEMVGGIGNPQLYKGIKDSARKLPNLIFHGFVPYHKIDEYFERCSIFVNTSSVEGFPNTFIQAWAHYTPVVSLSVDPDKIVRNEKLGFCSGTFKRLVSDVNTLLEDEELRKTMGENARKYVEREHDVRKTVKKYMEIFEEIA